MKGVFSMSVTHCHSCGMALNQDCACGNYCQYCIDEKGNLLPRETIKAGIADWLKSFSPHNDKTDFEKRAEHYMKAMPAWADAD